MQRGHGAPEKRQRATIEPRPEPLKNSQIRIFGDSQYMCGWPLGVKVLSVVGLSGTSSPYTPPPSPEA
jgi:hypothetical protein